MNAAPSEAHVAFAHAQLLALRMLPQRAVAPALVADIIVGDAARNLAHTAPAPPLCAFLDCAVCKEPCAAGAISFHEFGCGCQALATHDACLPPVVCWMYPELYRCPTCAPLVYSPDTLVGRRFFPWHVKRPRAPRARRSAGDWGCTWHDADGADDADGSDGDALDDGEDDAASGALAALWFPEFTRTSAPAPPPRLHAPPVHAPRTSATATAMGTLPAGAGARVTPLAAA